MELKEIKFALLNNNKKTMSIGEINIKHKHEKKMPKEIKCYT